MGLHFGSNTRPEAGKRSAISAAILPHVLEGTKFEWIGSKQLLFVSLTCVASNTKGLKPSDWIRLRYSFDIVL